MDSTTRSSNRQSAIDNRQFHIAPSILSADFTRLGEQVLEVEAAGVDRVQIDIMDGLFVPNITFGPQVVEALRPLTRLTLEVHLMVQPPEDFIESFARAGADTLIIHQESTPHLHRAIQQIHGWGKKAGVAITPSTPVAMLSEVLGSLQLVLVMTVNPGFGGQEFIPETLGKIREVRREIEARGLDCEVEVDGGIHEKTIRAAVEAGANVLVAGSAVFDPPGGVAASIQRLIASAER
ncbi:MAG TPA: ribulose-phosphate 3-epimerase [Terriglobia bacterium]|nr:ribulose-phosphate 3-epimerase [Terriglobia bacterium]